jgi:hypothetical protein
MSPYPKWTKAEGQWARLWLIAVVLFVIVGILYSFIRAAIADPETIRFRYFSAVEAMYPTALATALEEKADARLVSAQVVSYQPMHEEALEYETRFYFCSPTDFAWALRLKTTRRSKLWGGVKLTRLGDVPNSETLPYALSCDFYSIEESSYNTESVVEQMRSALSESQLEGLETKPRWMRLARDEQGSLQWAAVFKYNGEDYALRIVLDTESGAVELVEELVFPEH